NDVLVRNANIPVERDIRHSTSRELVSIHFKGNEPDTVTGTRNLETSRQSYGGLAHGRATANKRQVTLVNAASLAVYVAKAPCQTSKATTALLCFLCSRKRIVRCVLEGELRCAARPTTDVSRNVV